MVDSVRDSARIGLCATCAQARRIMTAKASEFWLCEKSKSDTRFAKYPALPVRACVGYARAGSVHR